MRVLLLALGNPILCDDGVALHVLERMRPHLPAESDDFAIEEACTGGIDLLTFVMDFDRVLILDAVKTREDPVGHVGTYTVDNLRESVHSDSPHHTNFATAIELGRRVHPDRMPRELVILGVEVDDIVNVREELTPGVEVALPEATERALAILWEWGLRTS